MTANEFLDLVRRSQLVEEDQLTKFLGGLSAKNGRQIPQDPDALATPMVAAGLLTEWQSERLLAGKWKGFLLGDYTILRYLRKTGMGIEYVAEHTLLKHEVVILIPLEQDQDGATNYIVSE